MYSFSKYLNNIQYTSDDYEAGMQIIPSLNIFKIRKKTTKCQNYYYADWCQCVGALGLLKNLTVGSFYTFYYYPT